nr:MAG TPA: hypothetical protein [Caudoviricetes sp.]
MQHARMLGFRPPPVRVGQCPRQTISLPHRLAVLPIMCVILGRLCNACPSLRLVGMPRLTRILWV